MTMYSAERMDSYPARPSATGRGGRMCSHPVCVLGTGEFSPRDGVPPSTEEGVHR